MRRHPVAWSLALLLAAGCSDPRSSAGGDSDDVDGLRAGPISLDRAEFLERMEQLDVHYASPEGLQRPEGLSIGGRPDFLGIAAWIFDVYLNAKLRGESREAAWELVIANIEQSEEWRSKHPGQEPRTPMPGGGQSSIQLDRGEFLDAMNRLDDHYRSPAGLKRGRGLSIGGRPDFLGIAAWVFDVYLNARIAGQGPEAAWAAVEANIRGSDEWLRKHPNDLGPLPRVALRTAPTMVFPAPTDSNSPAVWADGELILFNSAANPQRASGGDLFSLGGAAHVTWNNQVNGGRWFEGVVRDDDGTLYAWYHREPRNLCPNDSHTVPIIGAARSTDGGRSWIDQGIVLEARPDGTDCNSVNHYFAGGHGDQSIALDANREYVYMYFSTYSGDLSEQGVGVARMAWADRNNQIGAWSKWHDESFSQPGLGGQVTPFFVARTSWAVPTADALWGPSVHYNTHLGQYVMLLNRTINSDWHNEGFYVSYARDLADPYGWSIPTKFFDWSVWYPQVIGLEPGQGTDKLAGQVARFFLAGVSHWEIVFDNP